MYGWHELKAFVDQCHEEILQEAQTRGLAKRANGRSRGPRAFGSREDRARGPKVALLLAVLALTAVLLGAIGCGGTGSQAGAQAPDPEPPEPSSVSFLGQRVTQRMSLSTSMECYTFYADGSVELRHNGASAATDSGSYQVDGAGGGQIAWNSGRTSYVTGGDGSLRINDLEVERVDSCLGVA